jgi:hypothetical protein
MFANFSCFTVPVTYTVSLDTCNNWALIHSNILIVIIEQCNRNIFSFQAEDAKADDELDLNSVVQLLSPLIASQRFMLEEVSNGYQVIHCEDGICFVFDQVSL